MGTLDVGCGSAPSGDVNLDRQYFGKGKNFVIADAHYIPFKNKAFDKIYSSYLLEHLENPCKFFREARRVLKDGGILECIYPSDSMMKKGIVLELLNLSIFKALKWKKRIMGDKNDPCTFGGHKWQLPDDRVLKILEKAGFTEVLFYKIYSKSILERGGKWLDIYKLPRIDKWKIAIQANKYLPKWQLDTKFIAKI